jgi:ribosomal protein S18 acetylase RimI-like enzyme
MQRQARLRPEQAQDEPFVYGLFAQTRAVEAAQLPLSPTQREFFLRQQFQLQAAHYRRCFPGASFSIVDLDGCSIGRMYVDRPGHDIRLIDITLVPDCRNQGIGRGLLACLLSEARNAGQAVRLHVERGNAALRLYQRLGFREIQDKAVYLEMEWRTGKDDSEATTAA